MSLNTYQKYLTRYFPIPNYLDIPSVGVDISSLAIRFIEIIPNKENFSVGRYGHERLKNIFDITNPESREEVKNALTKWKDLYKLDFVEVSLPEEKAYLFKIDVPLSSEKEMSKFNHNLFSH